ncbi:hypothetical protein FHT44_003314 [Mycolicibacterium sp. BK634]|uniref:ImmA/IrrE family metallo-endopeptidase n=1 Tax=Mycolicibacterium sp. BK634 TaxID=2587099 RepID=UPI001615F16D|nr:ImmA/IrrE family metallo-endopeptidase [Mycolicibacterium sp. BK634]MBB3750819.1 hypothetical protein [Mycolicibacterium sp. BK634]
MLSDLELAQLASPGTGDADLVIALMRETLADLGLATPIDHNLVASYRGVIRIEQLDIPWSGQITPTEDGLVIGLRARHSRGRQRFSAFHEITHTYMRGFRLQPQYRCDPEIALPKGVWCDPVVEALCDQGAAELLFPREAFLSDLVGNRVNLDLVEELAQHYEASLAATAARVCDLNPRRTLFLTLEPATKPREPYGEPKLRVRSCIAGGAWRFVPKHKSASEDGVFYRALDGEIIDETIELDELTTPGLGRVHVSARLYPYTDDEGVSHMRVLALVTEHRSNGQSRVG